HLRRTVTQCGPSTGCRNQKSLPFRFSKAYSGYAVPSRGDSPDSALADADVKKRCRVPWCRALAGVLRRGSTHRASKRRVAERSITRNDVLASGASRTRRKLASRDRWRSSELRADLDRRAG